MSQQPVDETSVVATPSVAQLTAEAAWERDLEGIHVVQGVGALAELGRLVAETGGQRVLLVGDPGITAAGHSARALESLTMAGLEPTLFDAVDENPTDRNVAAGTVVAREHRADFLVGLGGGSAMDCAKGINFVLSGGEPMSRYQGFGLGGERMLPSIGVPTTAGTGSEAQSYALITDSETHRKMACGDLRARFRAVILDPQLTDSMPSSTAAAAALDAVAHSVESFVTTSRTEASSALALDAWRTLDRHLVPALGSPGDHATWGPMQIGAFLAGSAIERSMLGAAHALSNPLTARYGTTHGIAVSLMLPEVVRFNGAVVGSLYAELLPDAASPVEELASRIEHLRSAAGLPATIRDSGVPEDERSRIGELAEQAATQWTLGFNPRSASLEDLIGLYERTF